MRKAWPIVVLVFVVIVAGVLFLFNKNNSAPKQNASGTAPSSQMGNMSGSSQSSSSNTASNANKVTISGFAFSPNNTTVKKGTTITWTNQDDVAHTITETDGQDGPASGSIDRGQSYSFTYNTPGTFKYHCSIHPSMTGSVTVTD